MGSDLHQNCILTGSVDSYCLVCESHLRTEDDCTVHINKPVHLKNLDACPYFQKHCDDHIRKVKKGYFCKYCNLLLPTAAKVSLHVAEKNHKNNKGSILINRTGSEVIIAENLAVSELAWNGIIIDTCVVCNAEFDNMQLHISDQKHILNLIQKRVEFVDGSAVYRKIDETSFHCLVCNAIYSLNDLIVHSAQNIHKTEVEKCRNLYKANSSEKETTNVTVNKIVNGSTEDTKRNTLHKTKENKNAQDFDTNNKVTETDNKIENATKSKNTEKSMNTDEIELDAVTNEQLKTNNNNSNKVKESKDIYVQTQHVILKANHYSHSSKDKTKTSNTKDNILTQNNTDQHSEIGTNNQDTKTDKKKNPPKSKNTEESLKDANESKAVTNEKLKTLNNININNIDKSNDSDVKENYFQTQPIVLGVLGPNFSTHTLPNMERNDKDDILERVTEFQKSGININFETKSVFCKKCFGSAEFSVKDIERHIESHKKDPALKRPETHALDEHNSKTILNEKVKLDPITKPTKFDLNHNETRNNQGPKEEEEIIKIDIRKQFDEEEGLTENGENKLVKYDYSKQTSRQPGVDTQAQSKPNNATNLDDPAEFAEANKLTFNKDKKNVYCRLCNKKIPAAIQNMREHVGGSTHKTNVGIANRKEKVIIRKKPMAEFLKNEVTIRHLNSLIEDVVLNDKYCVSKLSYHMISKQNNRLRCQVCEVQLIEDEIDEHLDSIRHDRAMDFTPVVCSFDTELVREVRPGLFHCGFCNLIVGKWEDVSNHLKCEDHEGSKSDAYQRLRRHLPDIREHRAMKERSFLRHMFNRFPFFL